MPALALSDARTAAEEPRAASAAGLVCEILELHELAPLRAEWDDLAARGGSASPFYGSHVVEAHAELGLASGFRVVAARRGAQLVALLPVRERAAWFGLAGRIGAAWSSPYTPSGNPLADEREAGEAAAALLGGLRRLGGIWILPRLTLEGAIGAALRDELRLGGLPFTTLERFGRPVLERRPDWPAYLDALGPRRVKEMRRRARKLGRFGEVALATHDDPEGLREAVDVFLRLEVSGWKGRRGSAMASRPATAALARKLFGRASGPVRARADILTVGGRPAAASLALVSGGSAFMMKAAFDEALAPCSPGMALEEAIVRACHEERFAERLNSVGGPRTHLAGLYPEREEVADLVFATDPSVSRRAWARAVAAEETRRRWLQGAKDRWRALGAERG